MRKTAVFWVCAVFVAACEVGAATYYFSDLSGDDSRSSVQAQNPATPWKTVTKANSLTLAPGDSVLFRAGELFRGALEVRGSGTAAAPVVYSRYGDGADPVICGTEPLTGTWTAQGNGVFRTAAAGMRPRQLFYDGVPMTVARYPNRGYLTVDSVVNPRTSFRCVAAGAVNWTGAALHIRTEPWSLDARKVSACAGGLFTLASTTNYDIDPGEAFFINAHAAALDSMTEWYWDSAAGIVSFAPPSATAPAVGSVEVTVYDIGADISGRNNVVMEHLTFTGHFSYGIRITGNSSAITVRACAVRNAYGVGIGAVGGSGIRIEDCTVEGTNYYGIECRAPQSVITRCTVRRIGLVSRLGPTGLGGGCCLARGIDFSGRGSTVSYNRLDSIGYNAIGFSGPNQTIERNVISYYCLTTYDGSAIYTWSANYADTGAAGSVIRENIITGGAGPGRAVVAPGWWSNGIYLDDRTHDIRVEYNTVSHAYHGIYFHNTKRHTARGNVVFDCTDHSLLFSEDLNGAPGEMSGNVVVGTEVFMLDDVHRCVRLSSQFNTWNFFARLDSNRYWNPYSSVSVERSWRPDYPSNAAWAYDLFSLDQWRGVSGHDLNSRASTGLWPAYRVTDTLSPEMIVNGGFDAGVSGWWCWSERNMCSLAWESNGGLAGGALRATLAWHDSVTYALVYGQSFAVVQGATYALRFSARAARPTVDRVIARMAHTPWSTVGLSAPCAVDTTWRDFEFVFSATTDDPSCRIDFQFNRGDSALWLDNVSLRRVNTQAADNRARVFLAVNQEMSARAVTIPPGTWRDLWGGEHRGAITLEPYRSRILVADSPSTVARVGGSAVAEPAAIRQVRVTGAGRTLAVAVELPCPAWVDLDILDTRGRRCAALHNGMRESGAARFVWTAPAGGVYVVRLRNGRTVRTQHVVVR